MTEYIQLDDIQCKVNLEHVGGINIVQEAGTMTEKYWVWRTARKLNSNDMKRVYREEIYDTSLVGEYDYKYGGTTIVEFQNVAFSKMNGNEPIGFVEVPDDI